MSESREVARHNIRGVEVRVKQMTSGADSWYCAYATIPGSSALKDEYLSPQTFRDEDEVGVDTRHCRNDRMTMAEKYADALHQIEAVIIQAQKVLK